ncbi:hypothetical protein COMA2_40006 [Candidatus Nitrospira nitrificans]|uniref:Uncharacterized protein n=1 Tax=Candidatus Nitrospira nitrificans TaxID=1742973 RepID=A0A0S4LMJ8_9BACT|nr:hypothetical protein COMA2_40006 [Candidatus Nitrospira nitrificans]
MHTPTDRSLIDLNCLYPVTQLKTGYDESSSDSEDKQQYER